MTKNFILTLKILLLATLFIITITAGGCSLLDAETDDNEISKLKNEIHDIMDGGLKVPLPEGYPLIYAYLRKPPVEIENGPYEGITPVSDMIGGPLKNTHGYIIPTEKQIFILLTR